MRHSRTLLILTLLIGALLILPFSASAQGGRSGSSRPAPSGSGGSAGGPGMSGAALSAGGGSASRGGGGQGGGSFQAPQGGGQGAAGQGGGIELPQGGQGGVGQSGAGQGAGGERPTLGGGQAEGGERPTFGGRQGEGESPFGGGFVPFSGEGGGLQGRFGERGGGSFSLETFLSESGFAGFEQMGENAFLEAFQSGVGSMQESLEGAAGQAQETVDAAVDQAQAAYDQLWTDYYAAVDYTAQTYYDTVTASADYLYQTYLAALAVTTETINSYTAYYDDYLAYCALYPWDCYAYAYDAATGAYYYTGETSSAPTTTITIGDVTVSGSYPAASAPTPSAEAYEALVIFANDQLGAVIDPLYAGAYTGEFQQVMAYLPPEMQAYAQNLVAIAGATYWGLWQGGGGAVMVGDCASNPSACAVSGDTLSMQLSGASAGVYGLLTGEVMPADASAALHLVTRVYPKLTGLSFAQISDIDSGYAFTATTASMGFDPATGQPISAAKVITAGVVSVNGTAFVYALVGVGEGFVTVLS
ncbi:MAG: hypothetical protein JNL42_08645 [Anaerolineae bacterium]|nr:hypothetical protein [Anaerolineae bacterium]